MRKVTTILAATAALLTLPAAAQELPAPANYPGAAEEAHSRIAVIERHIDAYRSGDLEAFVATFTPDAVVRADGFVAIGHEQIKALYELNFEPGAPQLRVHDSGVEGDKVTVSVGYLFADGQEMCCSVSEYEVRGGRVSAMRTRG
jgi:hypothetical protein